MKSDKRLKWLCFGLAFLCLVLAAMAVDHSRAIQKPREEEYWPVFLGIKLKITDTFVVLLTAALAIYTKALNQSTLKLWRAGEKQNRTASINAKAAMRSAEVARDTLIASHRAWITCAISLNDQKMQYGNGGVSLSVVFDLKNVGNAPALNVSCHAWLLGENTNVPQSIRDRNDRKAAEAKDKYPDFRFCFFPGQTLSEASGYTEIHQQAIMPREEFEASILRGQPGGDVLIIFLGGVVNYEFASDPGVVHKTIVLYQVCRKPIMSFFNVGAGDLPQRELYLQVPLMGGHSAT